ncbi:hypothetical protein SNE40_022160 [Patella caerulea]|uniref:Endonuclease/exonuclease/phosphatase domain-containing protein n=1 Tax=Patella caerulea TaxID=87958 RepID=A0AAN8G3B4_PATCE
MDTHICQNPTNKVDHSHSSVNSDDIIDSLSDNSLQTTALSSAISDEGNKTGVDTYNMTDSFSNPFITKRLGFKLCHLNINRFYSKFDEVKDFILDESNKIDILGLTETFLHSKINVAYINISNFEIIRKDRCNKIGGGLIMYVKSNIIFKRRPDLEIGDIETIWIEITPKYRKSFLLCLVYRPLASNLNWYNIFESPLNIINSSNIPLYIMGDINIDFNVNVPKQWSEILTINNLHQLVDSPTRCTQNTETTIDHLYTNAPDTVIELNVPVYGLSDHYPVIFIIGNDKNVRRHCHLEIEYRNFKHFNE